MYDSGLADVYDQIYAAIGKDYATESAEITDLVRKRNPDATSLLDVACGTGEHLRYLRDTFSEVEAVEISGSMRAIAAAKLPELLIHAGDMRTFALGREFDVVLCLFSAIGYMRDTAELRAALGVDCTVQAIHYALLAMGLTYKKRRSEPANRIEQISPRRGGAGSSGKAASISETVLIGRTLARGSAGSRWKMRAPWRSTTACRGGFPEKNVSSRLRGDTLPGLPPSIAGASRSSKQWLRPTPRFS